MVISGLLNLPRLKKNFLFWSGGIVIGVVVLIMVIVVTVSGIKSGVCRKTSLNSIGCQDVATLETGRTKLENDPDATSRTRVNIQFVGNERMV